LAVARQPIGAGANRGAAGIVILGLCPRACVAGDDLHGCQFRGQQGVRGGGVEADGERVHDFSAGDGADHAGEGAGAIAHIGHAFDGKDHVIGGEIPPIMPFDTGAELEFPDGIGKCPPAFRQHGLQPCLGILFHQPVEHVLREADIGGGIVEMRVKRGGRPADADGEVLRQCAGSAHAGEQQGGQGKTRGAG